MVRYDPDEVDRFIEVADSVEDAFPKIMVDGEEAEGASGSGMFEVLDDEGQVLYSASQQGGRFPDADEIVMLLQRRK